MISPLADRLSRAREILSRQFGYPDFRPLQRRVVQSVLAGRDTLAVLPTGGGKSICFQVPALVLGGVGLVVSPLISLMQDQVSALRGRGISAAFLNSTLGAEEQGEVMRAAADASLRLLYVSPERLPRLCDDFARLRITPSLLAVDEAHCIAEWGHDFRPHYRKLRKARWRLGHPPTIALTGSATPDVRRDIASSLGLRAHDVHLGSFDRPNLWFGAVPVTSERARLEALLGLLRGDDRLALVYAPTRNLTEGIARALVDAGLRAAPYHAGLGRSERRETLERFLADDVEVVAATSAFGMGIDKPDVRLVVHWMMPPTPESYYQEAGRAGRDGALARCVLLHRPGDGEMHRRQLDVTFPPRRLLEKIWWAPGGARGVPGNVLASADRLRRELHPERGWVDWTPVKRRREAALSRLDAMMRYAVRGGCRRAALVGYFGERLAACAGCDRCRTPRTVRPADPRVRARLTALRRALSGAALPWGGQPLEGPTLLRLAAQPPADAASLADVPGVGAELAERFGGLILRALGVDPINAAEPVTECEPLLERLRSWREAAANAMGVPPYAVLRDGTLEAVAAARPADRLTLARVAGVGPRALAKFGDELVRCVKGATDEISASRSLPE